MKTSTLFPTAALCAAFAVSAASAATVPIGVSSDANIRSDQVDANSNGSQLVLVGDLSNANHDVLHGLFSFDLGAIPVGATINSVTLVLYANGQDPTANDSAPVTLQVYQLNSSFNEASVTWNASSTGNNWATAGGDYSGPLLASLSASSTGITANQVFSFTSENAFATSVSATLGGEDKTLNLLVKLSAADGLRNVFRFNAGTKSGAQNTLADAQYRPQLVIDFTPIPEPSAFAAVAGLGAVGLVASRRRSRR